MISKKIEKAFNEQLNMEQYSSHLYLSMATYFDSNNLKGFAHWMKEQAREEIVHVMKFYSHLDERRGRITLKGIAAPKTTWKSPLEAFQDAYNHEVTISGRIDKLVALAAAEKDNPASVFLQWFVTEQVEEESSTDAVVQVLKMIKSTPMGIIMLDRELAKRGA